MSLQEAFFGICKDAIPAKAYYVSLYLNQPFYGGAEEGGWWGNDTVLIAYQQFPTEEAAQAAREAVEKLASELNTQARREFGEQCQREMEWLESRGLEADYLPEVNGEDSYFVAVEYEAGEQVCRGNRHYE
jgi:hypothetical protein